MVDACSVPQASSAEVRHIWNGSQQCGGWHHHAGNRYAFAVPRSADNKPDEAVIDDLNLFNVGSPKFRNSDCVDLHSFSPLGANLVAGRLCMSRPSIPLNVSSSPRWERNHNIEQVASPQDSSAEEIFNVQPWGASCA